MYKIFERTFFALFVRFQQAWNICEKLNEKNAWLKLGQSAIANLNVAFGKHKVSSILYYGIKIRH